ncbi:MAG TPA: TonB family protein [Nevskia sp.]|nr:TonB family protein [Nevskia sp.]
MATQESPPLAVGTRLDAYTITEVVEQGRYSHAYSARDAAGTEVLIKEFLPHEFAVRDGDAVRPRDADDKTPLRFWLRSFLDKAVLLQKLNHPGLVRVLKQFEANGTGYYVTERVAGQSLAAILQRDGTLSEPQLRRLLAPVLAGLEQAHAVGLLHRDIRPENLILRADDSAVLTDFGVLRAPIRFKSRTVFSAGAPPYAAPEEFFMAGVHGPWTDLYALGATAYHVVTGQPPPDARSRGSGPALAPVALSAKVRLSESLAAAIDEALHLIAEQRPQSVAGWRAMLQGAAAPDSAPEAAAALPAAEYQAAPRRSRLPLLLGVGAVLAGAAGAYSLLRPSAAPAGAPAPSSAAAPVAAAAPAASVTPAAATDTAAAPAPPAGGGTDLDRLAQDLMNKEKKLAEARDQLQAEREQAKATPVSVANKAAQQQAAPAAAQPGAADADAAEKLRQLQAEVERLRKEKEAQATAAATTVASAAPAVRSGSDFSAWYRDVTGSVRQSLRYPQRSLQGGEEGDITVRVHLKRDGSIVKTEILQRSSYSALNSEALAVFARIGHFSAVPSDYQPGNPEVDFSVPINFKLNGGE